MEDQDDSSLDAVTIGDLIVLKAKSLEKSGGYLRGDGAGLNLGVQLPIGNEQNARDSLQFEDYVFRVCPALTYRQKNELEAVSGRSSGGGLKRRKSIGQMEAAAAALSMLESRVEFEEASNATVIEQLRKGLYTGAALASGETKIPLVRYGDIVMLQHMKSGCFLTALESAAPCDPECRATKLVERDSAAGLFRLTPRFKAQTEGSIVYYNHTLKVESVKMRGMLLHASDKKFYSDIPDPLNPALPKCLQTGISLEINLSPEFTAFSIGKYGRFGFEDQGLLKTGDPFRLYHSQTESFMHASCDAEKDRRYPQGRADGWPAHIPYLKKLPDLGDTPDPTDPQHHYPKGVWCFEPRNRRSCAVVSWDAVYRLRHVPSGRYLAVDTTEPMHEETEGMPESWYGTCLVDDASLAGEEVAIFDDAGNEVGFKVVPENWLEFIASSADVASGNKVPFSDVNLRLTHFFKGHSLFLHCNEERKPLKIISNNQNNTSPISIIARTLGLVFSTVKSAQDIFKALPISEEEKIHIEAACSFRPPLALYIESLSNPTINFKPELAVDTISLLLKILDSLVQGKFSFSDGDDWVTKANSLLPVAFSNLFGGEPYALVQRISRDVKLMDFIFAMGHSHYTRTSTPWTTGPNGDMDAHMAGPQAVHKFVHVALQKMCVQNKESQEYVGNRNTILLVKKGSPVPKPINWMTVILDTLDDPLGSAVTLSQLLNENESLMHKYATPDLVERFLVMIRELGPQPRLVNFFEAICTVGGVAVKANQEMVLRLTWMDEVWRKKVYLETKSFEAGGCQPSLPKLPQVREPSGAFETSWAPDKNTIKNFPSNYIGKKELERDGAFAPVFIQWSGANEWSRGMDELWYSPKALNIKTYSIANNTWARLEDLCWVLEPERLCVAITGKSYSQYKSEDSTGAIKKQTQLAQYYAGQLSMLSRLCYGRSYNCIDWMEKSFPYTTLCSMCYSIHLPAKIRAMASDLIDCLYLDRFPQLKHFGRPTLPEQLWVYELKNEALLSSPNLPLIKHRNLADEDALPGFALSTTHHFYGHENEFLSFPSHFKFFALRYLGNKYLESFGKGTVVHSQKGDNELAHAIVSLISSLTSFGFQSTHQKIQSLLTGLVAVLDGRTDVAELDDDYTHIPFTPASQRYITSPLSAEVTALKASIINVLLDVANLRANFRLGKLLQKSKDYAFDKKWGNELKKIHSYVEHDQGDDYDGELNNKLFNDFEELFESGDGAAMDLGKLSGGQEVDLIAMDCLMYEDDKLFAKALELLERTYGQRRKLLNSLSEVVLLPSENIPIFGTSADMSAEINFLTFLVRSSEVWAVSSRVSGPFQDDRLGIVQDTITKLERFILCIEENEPIPETIVQKKTSPRSFSFTSSSPRLARKKSFMVSLEDGDLPPLLRQDILRSMDLQTSLIDSLRMDYNISFKGSICSPADKIKSRELLISAQRKLIELLVLFVKGNIKNQNVVFKHLNALRNHRGNLKLPDSLPADFTPAHKKQLVTEPGMNTEAVIVECLRNNAQLCQDEVPRDLIEEFGVLVDSSEDPTTCPYLVVFNIVCQPKGGVSKAIPRNQEMVLEVLLSDSLVKLPATIKSVFIRNEDSNSENDSSTCGERPERIVQLFSACIRQGNLRTASKLQAHRVTIEATVRALCSLCGVMDKPPTRSGSTPPGTLIQRGKAPPPNQGTSRRASKSNNLKTSSDSSAVSTSKQSNKQSNDTVNAINSPLFNSLLEFLSLQLEVLVVDPKLFRLDETWKLLTVGIKGLLLTAGKAIPENKLSPQTALAVTAALKIGAAFIDGALQLGIRELEGDKSGALLHDEDSLYKSAVGIASYSLSDLRTSLGKDYQDSYVVYEMDTLKTAAVKLCNIMDPAQHLSDEDPEDGEDDNNDVMGGDDEVTEDNTVALTKGDGGVEMVPAHSKQRLSFFEDLKNSSASSSPQNMTKYFAEALDINPKLNHKLKARQFSLVTLLENIEESTGEIGMENKVNGADGAGSVSITWPMLVQRMEKYLRQHNHDRDESNCLRVLRVLRSHLLKARSEPDGSTMSMWDLPDNRRQAYVDKQSSYVEYGVASICLTAIATHPSNVEGNLADEGVEMLLEMSQGGNVAMQDCLSNFILEHDRDNKFAWHIKGRLDNSLNCIKDRKERCEVSFTPITPSLRHEYKNAIQTFEMLQQLCEGHNLGVQNVLRVQPGHTASVDLMTASANILITLCDTSRALLMMEEADVQLVIALLLFLTEAIQGPCPKNQELLVSMDGVVAGVDKVLQSIFDPRIRIEVQLECKSAAALLLAGMLEGRSDMIVHRMLAEDLGPQLFELLRHSVMRTLDKASNKKMHSSFVNVKKYKDLSLELMSSVSTVLNELRKVDAFALKMDERPKRKNDKKDLMEEEVRVIEVLWNNRIECTSFSVPQDASYLSLKTKEEFLKNADLSTSEKRMKQLLTQAPVFMAEMEQICALSNKSRLYAFINHNIVNIKWSMYALVVLLNLNIVMASYGKGSPDGYVSIADAVLKGNVQDKYVNSLIISIVLAVLNLCGYVVIVSFLAITEVPIIVKELDDYVEECEESLTMKEDEYRDPGAFTWWFVTLIFNVVFIIQHSANYPNNQNPDLYSFLVFGINMPWTMSCIRNYVVVPNTRGWRIFCVIYDVLITKPFFRNHVLLMVCSLNGFGASYYFPLMLMDIMNNSNVIANIARSVTDNIVELGWVFYLFVITIIIYAQFGLEFFEEWFTYDGDADDEEAKGCHSVVSCFVLIFYHGAPSGSLDDVFDPISNRVQPTFLKRVLFDLSFFVWVGVLLFNIITGLMVDGFGALREEDNERKDTLENSCFVCGFTREAYDDIPNFQGPAFDWHKTEEHEFWSYIHFYVYLKRKNKANLTGVESYVWTMIQTGNLAWIPLRSSAAIQETKDDEKEDEEEEENENNQLSKIIAKEVGVEVRTTMESMSSKQAANKESSSKPWEGGGSSMTMSAFLGWGGMERFAPSFIAKGFPDPASLGDLSNLDDNTLAQDFGLNSTEIRRLKALVELRDVNSPSIGRVRGLTVGSSSNNSFNNPPASKRTSFFNGPC